MIYYFEIEFGHLKVFVFPCILTSKPGRNIHSFCCYLLWFFVLWVDLGQSQNGCETIICFIRIINVEQLNI